MEKEPLLLIAIKTLLAVVIFAEVGTIIIGGGYIIKEYSKNETSNKIIKPVNQETYYEKIAEDCEKFKKSKLSTDYDCCLQSVEAMKNGNFKLASKNGCQEGFQTNSFWCGGSYSWCEPIRKNTWKNCEQDSDCVETRADCCNCNNGGEQIGINKKYLKVWEDAMKNKCQDVGCIALFNCRKGEVVCEDNQCEFKEKINNNDQLDASNWQTYRNEEFGFEFKYPICMRIKTKEEELENKFLGDVNLIMMSDNWHNGYSIELSLCAMENNNELSFKDALNSHFSFPMNFIETKTENDVQVLKPGKQTEAYWEKYGPVGSGLEYNFWFVRNQDHIFGVHRAQDYQSENLTEVADQILFSFKFTEK